MSRTLQRIFAGVVTGPGITVLYTVPAVTKVELREWRIFAFPPGDSHQLFLHLVSGAEPVLENLTPSASVVEVKETSTWVVMYPGDQLQYSSDLASTSTIEVTGIVLTTFP